MVMRRGSFGIALGVILGALLILVTWGCRRERNPLEPPSRPVEVARGGQAGPPSRESSLEPGASYYDARLHAWDEAVRRRAAARISIHEEELQWVATPQDARVALLVASETGFDPWGLETSVAEIPAGWHTGRHRHGEEALYIVAGSGFILVAGVRYDFFPGTTIGIPFGAEHQLYNTGAGVVRYLSATPFPLERFWGVYRLEQLEQAGPTQAVPRVQVSSDGYDAKRRRIRLLWEDANYRDGRIGFLARLYARLRAGVDLAQPGRGGSPRAKTREGHVASAIGHHSAWVNLMGQEFPNRLVLMSGLLIDDPGVHSGKHAHPEAVIYVLQGHGYSVVDGKRIPWKAGTCLHIQGPQTVHQHFNTGPNRAILLRIASGLRPAFETAVADVFPFLWFEGQGLVDRDSD